ncbi:hypothetical protein A9Q93_11210 [Nonlabens dokdonensis]|uniref:DUF4890 domain-containing protein n=2 Tax=Nonlabens dokdonensis TaxID=328515 RepID=A0A1Z8AM25_9FLAO|nr:hypothetical protein A9Q93_11210 [Nonlabens dokdonensis]
MYNIKKKKMKKLMILVAILTVGFANAQRGMRDSSPEQIASIKSKKMTLALDLNTQQQSQVESILLKEAKERAANRLTKEERAELTKEQKVAKMEKMLEKRIETKRQMKSILNADQYAKFEKMMAKDAQRKMKDAKKRRGKRD